MRRIIAIVDPDHEYARRLASYINDNDSGGLKAVTFTGADNFIKHKDSYDTRMMLIDENEAGGLHDTGGSYVTICLSEDNFASTDFVTINKYSGADTIVSFMLARYAEVSRDTLRRTSLSRSHLITVYSPVGRCGKTSFAITAAQYLGMEGRCLMLSLDEYSGIFRYIAVGAQSDLSDVIYACKQGRYSWAGLARTVCRFGSMDYIAPARYPEDLAILTGDQMTELLDRIAAESGYDNIVLDLGSYGKRAVEILEMSNEVFMPTHNSELSRCKLEEFMDVMRQSGREDLIGRIRQVSLPHDERICELPGREEEYMYGRLFEYTRDLFTDPGQSDEAAHGYAECKR